ncbi:MAG: redoxin domain-containing protein [Patescibacteria group bacterium]
MKPEIIIGFIVLSVFGFAGYIYVAAPPKEKEKSTNAVFQSEDKKKEMFTVAPDISTPDGFINTDGKPISISEFKGKKVVLLDIWTYSCINCQRTIPVLNELHKKYEDEGLVIIGLHTPEFAFERIQKNVEKATMGFGIKYPVVLDNDFSTWNAYKNRYWPRKYLIDIDGYIVYDHAGEGAYDETELAIQKALLERGKRLGIEVNTSAWGSGATGKNVAPKSLVGSPEIYFGASRNEYLENGKPGVLGSQTLTIPSEIKLNKLYLGGSWAIDAESSENKGGGTIVFKYKAKDIFIVANGGTGTNIEIFRDGKFLKYVLVEGEKLYPIIEDTESGEHTLMIKVPVGGVLDAFTFTFG